ncbi:MAG: carboxypeptidase-like regulatory domain-containing protein [Planctomycetota bacterium]
MKNAALLAAVALALLAGLSYVFLSGGGPDPSSGATLDRADAPAEVTESTGDRGADLVEVAEDDDNVARAAATPNAIAPGVAALVEDAEDGDESTVGALRGRVTDAAGAPLAGAEVRCSSAGGLAFRASFEVGTGDSSTTVVTDGDGRFETTVRGGDVRIAVGLDGYAPYERDAEVLAAGDTDVGDLRLAQGVRLSGRVLDPGGRGVPGAKIVAKPKREGGIVFYGGRIDAIAETDDNGRFEILRQAAGPYELIAVHEEHPPQPFAGRTEQPGEVVEGIVVTLRAGATIEGVVLDLPESGADGLRVVARGGMGPEGMAVLFGSRPGGPVTGDVDERGSFVLTGLEPGANVRLTLVEDRLAFDGSTRRSKSVPARAGDRNARITYSEGASVTFRVTDSEGNPVESMSVDAGFDYPTARVRRNETCEDGVCKIANLWPSEEGDALKLQIEATGFEPYRAKQLVVQPDASLDLGTIVLEERPRMLLAVTSAVTGEPVEGADVLMRPYRDPAVTATSIRRRVSIEADRDDDGDDFSAFDVEGEARGTTDADGRCELDATPGATVEFVVRHPDFAETVDGPVAVSTTSSTTEHAVALDLGGRVQITVVDPNGAPVRGARVERRGSEQIVTLGGDVTAESTDSAGVLTFDGLPAGDQSFRLEPKAMGGGGGFLMDVAISGLPGDEDDGDDWTKVAVLAGETVELTLVAPLRGVVRGEVTELGVPLAGAKLTLRRPESGPMAGMLSFGPRGPQAVTDARGEFRFDDVEEGEYEIVLAHPTRVMDEVRPVEAEGAETVVEIDLDVTIVEGTVVDEAGEPVVGAVVRPERAQPRGGTQQMSIAIMVTDDGSGGGASVITTGEDPADEVRTDEDGRYLLRGVEAGVELEIVATADGYDESRSERFQVDAGATQDGIDVQFVKPGSIRVTLEDGPGGAMVMLRRRGEFRGQPRIEPMAGDEVTIDGVAPGDWTVRLLAGPAGDISTDPDDVDVTVIAGETATAEFVAR